jgi:hypothetical protein
MPDGWTQEGWCLRNMVWDMEHMYRYRTSLYDIDCVDYLCALYWCMVLGCSYARIFLRYGRNACVHGWDVMSITQLRSCLGVCVYQDSTKVWMIYMCIRPRQCQLSLRCSRMLAFSKKNGKLAYGNVWVIWFIIMYGFSKPFYHSLFYR